MDDDDFDEDFNNEDMTQNGFEEELAELPIMGDG